MKIRTIPCREPCPKSLILLLFSLPQHFTGGKGNISGEVTQNDMTAGNVNLNIIPRSRIMMKTIAIHGVRKVVLQ